MGARAGGGMRCAIAAFVALQQYISSLFIRKILAENGKAEINWEPAGTARDKCN
jgi:hypothetical protein